MTGKKELLSGTTKLADLIDNNPNLLGVVTRVGLHFGFGDDTVEEACRKNGVNPEAFLLICNVYNMDGYIPSSGLMDKVDLRDIVKYLHGSHSYYTCQMMSSLEDAVSKVLESCDGQRRSILTKFFSDYRNELYRHFEYEESVVFPYVNSVLDHVADRSFTILQYEENHTNVEEKLADFKNIVMKYLPPECDSSRICSVLQMLYSLEYDLRKHTAIEDDILVPLVNRLEKI